MITGSKELIRDMNTQLVLRTIMEFAPISRAAVSQNWDLQKPLSPPLCRSCWKKNSFWKSEAMTLNAAGSLFF